MMSLLVVSLVPVVGPASDVSLPAAPWPLSAKIRLDTSGRYLESSALSATRTSSCMCGQTALSRLSKRDRS